MYANIASPNRSTLVTDKESVLIVDDDPVSRLALTLRVKRAGHDVVGVASNGSDGLLQILRCSPSLMLLDMDMPHMEGMSVLRKVRYNYPGLKVLVLTMLDARLYAHRCMQLGADGFLDKNRGLDLLSVAIERIQHGKRIFPTIEEEDIDSNGCLSDLGNSEVVVLRCLARGGDNTCIANALQIDYRTAGNLSRQLRKKLGLASQKQMIEFAQSQKLG